jgi:DNA-binding transcriptional ArsR family regulator
VCIHIVVVRRVTDPRDRPSEIEFRADYPRDATAVRSRASASGTGSFAGPTVPMADEAPDAFEALLGWQRARILKGLDGAQRPGQIAEALRMVPAGATHHLSRLEAAGLVIRKRSGRHVVVERTARGSALLELYAEDSEILESLDSGADAS